MKPLNGYMLVLPMKEYFQGLLHRLQSSEEEKLTSFDVLYIPPVSSVGALFAHGEMFHARTKAKAVENGFFKYPAECASDLLESDGKKGWSIFSEPHFDVSQFEVKQLSLLTRCK